MSPGVVVGGVWCAGVLGAGGGPLGPAGGVGVLLGLVFLGVFECYCVSVGFGIRLVLGWFRGLCTVMVSLASNVVAVGNISVFHVFGVFCGLVGGGV